MQILFKINIFEKFFWKYHQGVLQLLSDDDKVITSGERGLICTQNLCKGYQKKTKVSTSETMGLICTQTLCRGYQKMTKVATCPAPD